MAMHSTLSLSFIFILTILFKSGSSIKSSKCNAVDFCKCSVTVSVMSQSLTLSITDTSSDNRYVHNYFNLLTSKFFHKFDLHGYTYTVLIDLLERS